MVTLALPLVLSLSMVTSLSPVEMSSHFSSCCFYSLQEFSAPVDLVVLLIETGANLSENKKQAGKITPSVCEGEKVLPFSFHEEEVMDCQCSAFPCPGGCSQLPRAARKEAACDYLGWTLSLGAGKGFGSWEINAVLPWSCIPGGIASLT